MTTKNQALSIKHQQEALHATFPHNTLYIALWIRNDPPPENDYHWAFYFHQKSNTPGGGVAGAGIAGGGRGGTQYQVNNVGSSSSAYLPDHQPTRAILKSNFLCVLVRISAGIPEERVQDLDRVMRTYDHGLNSVIPGVSCRVWMFRVLPLLVKAGFVEWRRRTGQDDDYDGVTALEDECKSIGNRYRFDAAMNVQPRPVVVSTSCRCEE